MSPRWSIYIGDDNALTLEVSAENQGEGAYEAELRVFPPQQADFTTVVHSQVYVLYICVLGSTVNGFISRAAVWPLPSLFEAGSVTVACEFINEAANAVLFRPDPHEAVLCVQERKPNQDGGVRLGEPYERRDKG